MNRSTLERKMFPSRSECRQRQEWHQLDLEWLQVNCYVNMCCGCKKKKKEREICCVLTLVWSFIMQCLHWFYRGAEFALIWYMLAFEICHRKRIRVPDVLKRGVFFIYRTFKVQLHRKYLACHVNLWCLVIYLVSVYALPINPLYANRLLGWATL